MIIIIIINVVVSALSIAVRPIVHYSVWMISDNKQVFRALRKAGAEWRFLIWGGIWFQILGPQTEKALIVKRKKKPMYRQSETQTHVDVHACCVIPVYYILWIAYAHFNSFCRFILFTKQYNVQVNTESVQCISIAYSEVRITEIREQLSRVDQSG